MKDEKAHMGGFENRTGDSIQYMTGPFYTSYGTQSVIIGDTFEGLEVAESAGLSNMYQNVLESSCISTCGTERGR